MDATKGSGSRTGTRSNPLGLERSQNAAINYGMGSAGAYKPGPRRPALPPAKKPSATGAAKKPTGAVGGVAARKPAGVPAVKKPATGAGVVPKKAAVGAPSKAPVASSVSSGKTRISAASKPKAVKK